MSMYLQYYNYDLFYLSFGNKLLNTKNKKTSQEKKYEYLNLNKKSLKNELSVAINEFKSRKCAVLI